MDEECISTYRIESLKDYYKAHCPEPRRLPWHRAVDLVEISAGVGVGPFTVKVLSKYRETLRKFTEGPRYRRAAWWWLHPHNPSYKLENLATIQAVAGLDHVERNTFLHHLKDVCNDEGRKHGNLRRWIDNRIALLDFELRPPGSLSDQLRDTKRLLRFSSIAASMLLWQDPKTAAEEARKIARNALEAGASAVCDVLGQGRCRISANLMVRTPISYVTQVTQQSIEANQKATKLWQHVRLPEHCLVILEETRGSSHIGFWVPLIRGDRDANLAGAGKAYFGMEADGVFKDDLPPLQGFPEVLADAWRAYIRENLRERLFVSVPLTVSDPTSGSPHVIAVMNVNADPSAEDGWRRAYHREWLRAAQAAAEDFIEVAFVALLIRMKVEQNGGYLMLDTEISAWNSLPGTGPSNVLPARR